MFHIHAYIGKSYEDVGERQKRRKRAEIKSSVNLYLAPLANAGLKATGLQLETVQTKEKMRIKLSPDNTADLLTNETNDPDKHIPSVAFLQLKYGLSKECYHELAMLSEDLPRSYKVSFSDSYLYIATCNSHFCTVA